MGQSISEAATPHPAPQDSRGAQQSGADLAETAWAPGLTASFPAQRQASNQTHHCPLMRVWAGVHLTVTKFHAITYHWGCSKVAFRMYSV